jgi:hypothetical protein
MTAGTVTDTDGVMCGGGVVGGGERRPARWARGRRRASEASLGQGGRGKRESVDDRKSSEHAAATAHPGGAVTTGRVLTLFCHRPAPHSGPLPS